MHLRHEGVIGEHDRTPAAPADGDLVIEGVDLAGAARRLDQPDLERALPVLRRCLRVEAFGGAAATSGAAGGDGRRARISRTVMRTTRERKR